MPRRDAENRVEQTVLFPARWEERGKLRGGSIIGRSKVSGTGDSVGRVRRSIPTRFIEIFHPSRAVVYMRTRARARADVERHRRPLHTITLAGEFYFHLPAIVRGHRRDLLVFPPHSQRKCDSIFWLPVDHRRTGVFYLRHRSRACSEDLRNQR